MYANISEEELKAKVALDFFNHKTFDSSRILGRVDFCVSFKEKSIFQKINFLWAEAKKNKSDLYASFVQLILTIGKECTFESELPPLFLGAFDCEKIAFLPYHKISDIFHLNDFNWNVTPSNYSTNEFKILYQKINSILKENNCIFYFEKDEKILKQFIVNNFKIDNQNLARISVNKDNFKHVYYRWMEEVAPSIQIDWEEEKPDILSADFFLADLLSENNQTLKETLRILLKNDFYQVKLERRKKSNSFVFTDFQLNDKGQAHRQFWNIFERPPASQYWDYILERRDFLVPMDVRERKGAFFTPQQWVVKAQEYLAQNVLNWEDFYIWDCAAGTGNLLRGLPHKPFQIYASTLDKADVEIMKDYYVKTGALLENNIFEFDFLNDSFEEKLPDNLKRIIQNEPEKLIIFINPPYAEATNARTATGTGINRAKVATETKIYKDYLNCVGKANRELFAQFFIRIIKEIPNCILASFSTLKYVTGQNSIQFRKEFNGEFLKGFICPAFTFDNVNGQFPIGFIIWNTKNKESIQKIRVDVFDENENKIGEKNFYVNNDKNIKDWLRELNKKLFNEKSTKLCHLVRGSADFQGNNMLFLTLTPSQSVINASNENPIYKENLMINFVFFAVRKTINKTWLNNSDQFLYPNEKWLKDKEFQHNCLIFTLFHSKNMVSIKEGMNHFIPFEESAVKAKEPFQSHLLNDFINGKIKSNENSFIQKEIDDFIPKQKIVFSKEAQEVLNNGKALFAFYHSQIFNDPKKPYQPNASLYDIKEFFQGRNAKGKMNPPAKCENKEYKILLKNLNESLKNLGDKIIPKIFEYGFLKE